MVHGDFATFVPNPASVDAVRHFRFELLGPLDLCNNRNNIINIFRATFDTKNKSDGIGKPTDGSGLSVCLSLACQSFRGPPWPDRPSVHVLSKKLFT